MTAQKSYFAAALVFTGLFVVFIGSTFYMWGLGSRVAALVSAVLAGMSGLFQLACLMMWVREASLADAIRRAEQKRAQAGAAAPASARAPSSSASPAFPASSPSSPASTSSSSSAPDSDSAQGSSSPNEDQAQERESPNAAGAKAPQAARESGGSGRGGGLGELGADKRADGEA